MSIVRLNEGPSTRRDDARSRRDPGVFLGLVGRGIQGSRSPALHEGEAAAQDLRLIYRLYDFDRLGLTDGGLQGFLDAASLLGLSGLNITHPFKQAVLPLLDEIDADAELIGAVNTVVFRGGKKIGYNTDLYGFSESFRRTLGDAQLDTVAQIGAGGAGAATAAAMLRMGSREVRIFDRDGDKAVALVDRLTRQFRAATIVRCDSPESAVENAAGIVNATPTGMNGHPGAPVPRELLRSDLWVADIVYVPLETELLRIARSIGCQTADGGGMAVYQAAAAFDLFTGVIADRERMLASFSQAATTRVICLSSNGE